MMKRTKNGLKIELKTCDLDCVRSHSMLYSCSDTSSSEIGIFDMEGQLAPEALYCFKEYGDRVLPIGSIIFLANVACLSSPHSKPTRSTVADNCEVMVAFVT